MDNEAALKSIREGATALGSALGRFTWSKTRTQPVESQRAADTRLETFKKESEPFRRLPPAEHRRIAREILAEETAARSRDASVARYNLEILIGPLAARVRNYIDKRKHDLDLSFPNALDHFGPGDMVNLELLRETLRPQIESAPIDDLARRYTRAFDRKDARGLIEAELIEDRMERGGIAQTPTEIASVKELADRIEGLQSLRVEPFSELSDIEETIAEARKAISRADVLEIRAANPQHDPDAKQAHEAAEREYREALAEAGQR
jgi:hypothetical protein